LDSFQGKEYDVILFSFTRSSNHELSIKTGKRPIKVGFLDDAKRLNVAFSRAKKKLILIGNSKTLTDKKSHFDLLFNYTELFSKLVRLSKEESIGNFVNIANVSEFKSPFDLFNEKYKIGDAAVAKFKFLGKSSGKVFGYFFHIDGFVCLLPISLVDKIDRPNFEKFTTDNELKVTILDINNESKKVTIKAYNETPAIIKSNIQKKPNIWEINISQIKKGQQIEGRVIKKIEIGYLVEIDNGLQGLLHITKIRRGSKIAVGDLINVSVLAIKHQKKRISFGYL
jgi:sRNA-binding carbon storage regulator CsrA